MDKIMVVLPDTDAIQAGMFCQKLSRNLENSAIIEEFHSDQGFCFAVNAGIAEAKEDSRLESLLKDVESRQEIFYECKL
jgi:PleD family two-component response regulator